MRGLFCDKLGRALRRRMILEVVIFGGKKIFDVVGPMDMSKNIVLAVIHFQERNVSGWVVVYHIPDVFEIHPHHPSLSSIIEAGFLYDDLFVIYQKSANMHHQYSTHV